MSDGMTTSGGMMKNGKATCAAPLRKAHENWTNEDVQSSKTLVQPLDLYGDAL